MVALCVSFTSKGGSFPHIHAAIVRVNVFVSHSFWWKMRGKVVGTTATRRDITQDYQSELKTSEYVAIATFH